MSNKYSGLDYVRAIIALLKFKGEKCVTFKESTYGDEGDIPFSAAFNRPYYCVGLMDGRDDAIGFSVRDEHWEFLEGCLTGGPEDSSENLQYLYEHIYSWLQDEEDFEDPDIFLDCVTRQPSFFRAVIRFKGVREKDEEVIIQVGGVEVPENVDKRVFFTCSDYGELKRLFDLSNGEDFIIVAASPCDLDDIFEPSKEEMQDAVIGLIGEFACDKPVRISTPFQVDGFDYDTLQRVTAGQDSPVLALVDSANGPDNPTACPLRGVPFLRLIDILRDVIMASKSE